MEKLKDSIGILLDEKVELNNRLKKINGDIKSSLYEYLEKNDINTLTIEQIKYLYDIACVYAYNSELTKELKELWEKNKPYCVSAVGGLEFLSEKQKVLLDKALVAFSGSMIMRRSARWSSVNLTKEDEKRVFEYLVEEGILKVEYSLVCYSCGQGIKFLKKEFIDEMESHSVILNKLNELVAKQEEGLDVEENELDRLYEAYEDYNDKATNSIYMEMDGRCIYYCTNCDESENICESLDLFKEKLEPVYVSLVNKG